jgi:hypothetical protein
LTQNNLSANARPQALSKSHQLGQSRVVNIDPVLYGIGQLIYVNIPKNASSWISLQFNQGVNHDAENINYYDIVDLTQCQFIVILRDPLDRWIAGMTQIIYTEPETLADVSNNMHIDTFDWKLAMEKIEYDNHTQKQVDFIYGIPHNQIVWLKFDDQLKDNFNNLMLSYGCDIENKNRKGKDNITSKHSTKNSVMKKIVNKLDQHPEYRQKIINHYHEDYDLFNTVSFYKKQ